MSDRNTYKFSPYRIFPRDEWAKLRADTPMTLNEADLEQLSGVNIQLSMDEVIEVYLPLSRLLNLYVERSQVLHRVTSNFLGQRDGKVPFIIGVGGSVAVGKSTIGRALRELLARWPNHPRVDLISTDGFLYPNRVLEERGIMDKKGFPQSFDVKELLKFMGEVKSGRPNVEAPVYSHFHYDILENEKVVVNQPDILIVEGLNVLQPASLPKDGKAIPFVSDFFDFSIYIDAEEELIRKWYIERFMRLRKTAFLDPNAYFHKYSKFSDDEALSTAIEIWESINLRNLKKNILPTRQRAFLILKKGEEHAVTSVALRKL